MSNTAVMRVASFPGGEAALAFGRAPSTPAGRTRFPFGQGASPVDVAASVANDEPVSPSSRNQKTHLQRVESLAFDMLFDSVDMEGIEESDEEFGDSDPDEHDPVGVYVRYATRPPARRLETHRPRSFSFASPNKARRPTAPFRGCRTAKIHVPRPMAARYPKNIRRSVNFSSRNVGL